MANIPKTCPYLRNSYFKSNKIIIEKLKEQKLLSNGELVHSYPHSWRSKAPLVIGQLLNGLFQWKVIN